jgi:formamidopyrimidine-DNA glycosylase
MPELPEVETIRRDLAKELVGAVIVRVDVRMPKLVTSSPRQFSVWLKNKKVQAIGRRGKLLIVSFAEADLTLLMHLKMTGQLIYEKKRRRIAGGHPIPLPGQLPNAYTHLVFHFRGGGVLYFNDLRQFGYAKLVSVREKEKIIAAYGIEPLTGEFTRAALSAELGRRTAPVKHVLLDQTAIAGLGNIYVDEICFAAGVRPVRPANRLTEQEIDRLYRACQRIIKLAIKERGTTFSKYRDGYGRAGGFVRLLKVYGRGGQLCKKCRRGVIQKIKVGGRGTTYCPLCQK